MLLHGIGVDAVIDLGEVAPDVPTQGFAFFFLEAGELKVKKIISREESPSRAQRLLNYGDVIFQIVRPYQRNNFYFKIHDGIKYVASTGYAQLRAFESKDFLFQVIHTDDFVEKVIAKCTGLSYPAINSSDLAEIAVAIPKPAEQQKIADCLSSVDELITTQTQKLDMLKAHKKGLMQQLFPAEGETLPRLRFPDFREAGEWEEKSLKTICVMQAGKFVAASDIFEQGNGGSYPCYGGNRLRGYTKTHTHSGKYPLIGRQGALCGNVNLVNGQFHATEHAVVVTPRDGINVDWLFYALDLLNLNRFATGQAQPGLSVEVLEKVPCAVPKEEREQQKIADCLTTVDGLIAAQTQKLTALKTHKKGLMQQLFPTLDEVQA